MDAGLSPSEFWSSTPREIAAAFKGVARRRKYEHDGRIALAWHVEFFARQKRLPKLEAFLKVDKLNRPQTVDEMIAIARRWHMAVNQ